MRSRGSNIFVLCLGLALAAFGYWSFATTRGPIPSQFQTTSGTVAKAEAVWRKGSLQIIHFSLQGSDKEFSYPSLLPRIDDVWDKIDRGTRAEVVHIGSESKNPELWGLKLGDRLVLSTMEAHQARRKNGVWGLVIGIASTLSVAYLWYAGKRRAA